MCRPVSYLQMLEADKVDYDKHEGLFWEISPRTGALPQQVQTPMSDCYGTRCAHGGVSMENC
jgi:hypothetical protein